MSKEKILEEFNEFTKTLEADFITEGYSAYGDLEDFISQTIDRVREETIREVENILDNYFKGLIMIPMPELTLNKIKQSLYKLKK